MCDCQNITFGTFGIENQNRTAVKTCHGKMQEIDNCILDELRDLWSKGIITEASCCGHNLIEGSIITDSIESANKMKAMGYVQYLDPRLQGFWFYPKSTPITNHVKISADKYIDSKWLV